MKRIPASKITDLILGQLSPNESLKVLEEIEKSEELPAELELVLDPINFVRGQKRPSSLRIIRPQDPCTTPR